MENRTDPQKLKGDQFVAFSGDFSETIAFNDHKISFAVERARGKKVLDIGCVHHNPENYKSKYWVHKALKEVASSLVGLDLFKPGVEYLNERGFNIQYEDAQNFSLGETFDLIFAGDIMEHLEDFSGFIESCKKHMHIGSKMIVSTPNPWYYRNMIKAALHTEVNNNPEHTCWLCPRTLRQLLNRHELDLGEVQFGSRYLKDRLLPIPKGWKSTSFHAEVVPLKECYKM
ncbi:MAG: methyltransferase domain-containing protein [Fibrobacterales bacterium]